MRCPPRAYPDLPPADVQVAPETTVVVDAGAATAWIRRGTCDDGQFAGEFGLKDFLSYRSITTVPVALETLTSNPWVIRWDNGGPSTR